MKRFDPALEAARDFVRDEIGADAGAQGLVLRLDPPLHQDRRGAAAAGHQQAGAEAGGRPQGGPRALLHAGARLAPRRHRALPLRRDHRGAGAARRAVRRLLLVRRHRVRQRRARPSRPDGRGADGLARGLPALRRERLGAREDLQPLVLPRRARSRSSTSATPRRASRSAPTATSSAASSRASPTPCSTAAPMRGADVEDGLASIRAMVAIARSAETGERVELADVAGAV